MEPDTEKLEFFLKLGYSREGVIRVLTKLGQGALVNDILQELIQMGGRPHIEDNYEENLVPKLVARGSGGTMDLSRRLLGSDPEDPDNYLRPIVIDGSNVAMSHGNKETFSCRGIRLAVDWFRERGHNYIKVFVPSWRKEPPRSDSPISEQHILEDLEKQAVLVYTPSRKVNGKRVVCYDDRYIVKVAYEKDGIIVSNDNYRDLQSENPEWKWFIEQRLLMFSFVNDKFMPPDDPLGRHGPTLSNFLSKKPKLPQASWQHCPYGRKCTYGSKCKFYHPERLHQTQLSVADELRAKTRTLPGSEEEQPKCSNVKTGPVPSLARPSLSPEGPWIPRGSTGSYRSYSNSSPGSRWREDRVPPLDRNFRGPLAESWEHSAQERLDPESAFPRNFQAGDVRFLEGQFSRLAFSDDLYGCDVPTGLRTTGIQRGVNSLDGGCNLNLSGCHGHLKSQQHSVDCACFQREPFQDGTTLTPYACRHPTVPGSCCNGPRESGPVLQKTFAPSYHPSRSDLRQSQRQTVYCPHPPAQFPIPQPTQPNEIRIREQAQKQPLGPSFWGDSSWGSCPFWRADSYLHFSEYKYPALNSVESESAFGQPFSVSSPRMK